MSDVDDRLLNDQAEILQSQERQNGLLSSGLCCPCCKAPVDAETVVCPDDGTELNPLNTDPSLASRYEIGSVLGSGGMGVIFKARHIILNMPVAIKIIGIHLPSATQVQRFQAEGMVLSKLSHPYIVKMSEFGVTACGYPYMVMDYVQGPTLAEIIRAKGRLSEEQLLPVCDQVCDALEYAHQKGIVHRDIKASNIMLTEGSHGETEAKVLDFGLAKASRADASPIQTLTKVGEMLGSPLYMSPEQANGGQLDARSDLYSLGCVMYEALTGSPPFVGTTILQTLMMQVESAPRPPSELAPDLNIERRLERIIMRLLQKNPQDRYGSALQLRNDLKALSGISSDSYPSQAVRTGKKRNLAIAGGVALMLVAAGVFVSVIRTSQAPKVTTVRAYMSPSDRDMFTRMIKQVDSFNASRDFNAGERALDKIRRTFGPGLQACVQESCEVDLRQAIVHIGRNEFDPAQELLDRIDSKLMKYEPTSGLLIDVQSWRGHIKSHQNDHEAAHKYFAAAADLAVHRNVYGAGQQYLSDGMELELLGQRDAARQSYDKAAKYFRKCIQKEGLLEVEKHLKTLGVETKRLTIKAKFA